MVVRVGHLSDRPAQLVILDGNGGIGDLPGVTAKLDHVAGLGVDAIWLAPFSASPHKDIGYDAADHAAVDPAFGTLDDFDALLERAHALGLRVLIDQVWSHTSDRHAWFLESRADRTNARADWFVWADPAPDGSPPNNWRSVFGSGAWTWEPQRRQYYLHRLLAQQPALNLHNTAVLDALLAIGEFWLRRGVDGLRLDAIDSLLHDRRLRGARAAPRLLEKARVAGPPRRAETHVQPCGLQDHLAGTLRANTAALLTHVRALTERYPGSVALGEVSGQPGAFERVVPYTAGTAFPHMAYTLRPLRGNFGWATVQQLLRDVVAANEDGWFCSFSNHDLERALSRWDPRRGSGSRPLHGH
jgi:alpha-glucosidase